MYDDHLSALRCIKQIDKLDKSAGITQRPQDQPHMLAYRKLLALNHMPRMQLRLTQDGTPRFLQVIRADVRQALQHRLLDPDVDPLEVALRLR